MGHTSKEELRRQNELADLSDEAAKAIEQAGRGLAACVQQCASNTADMKTVANMVTVAGYVNDATTLLLERERLKNPPPGELLLPGS